MRMTRRKSTMLLLARGVGLGILFVAFPSGCESKMKGYTGPVLAPADLGIVEGTCPENGYRLVGDEPSTGRFPSALAVVRVEPTAGSGDDPPWRLSHLKEEQAVYWNSLFNTTPEIRELMILNPKTPLARGRGVKAIAATAGRLSAGVCLVYGPAHAQADEAALLGHLLDSRTGASLACIASTAGPADFETARPDRPNGDRRHQDVQYLAARRFERLVRDCVIELIRRDSAPAATRPSPWQGMIRPEQPTIYVFPEPVSPPP
ncbi:MAG: hypothetical protein HRF43_06590 [Phycisphaerae bacterium]|jgi:hypothetical protein